MLLKPVVWREVDGVSFAQVVGIELSVFLDTDGTYTATLFVSGSRPEIAKLFEKPGQARDYAEIMMLRRELSKHFYIGSPK